MNKKPLFGKRVLISGSISKKAEIAKTENVMKAREFIKNLVLELVQQGANFVIPVDTERYRKTEDNLPICFDWLIWETIYQNRQLRPVGAPDDFVIGVLHHKNHEQIPEEKRELWNNLTSCPNLLNLLDVGFWNMNSKRMESQAQLGDILFTLGGEDGVLFLANLFLNRGKPVIPIDIHLSANNVGTNRIFRFGLTNKDSPKLFNVRSGKSVNNYLTQFKQVLDQPISNQINFISSLLLELENPEAFAIRLLNPKFSEFEIVEKFFNEIVQPVVENELNYKLVTIDEKYEQTESFIVSEIFQKIHHSSLVIADFTVQRPNCFLELGYALRNQNPVMLTKQKDSKDLPFDIAPYPYHAWNLGNERTLESKKLVSYFNKIRNIQPLVSDKVIIP